MRCNEVILQLTKEVIGAKHSNAMYLLVFIFILFAC